MKMAKSFKKTSNNNGDWINSKKDYEPDLEQDFEQDEEVGSQFGSEWSTTDSSATSMSSTEGFTNKIFYLNKRSYLHSYLIALIGSIACAGFLYIGLIWHKREAKDLFVASAQEMIHNVHAAWNDYYVAGLWIHQTCRSRNISRAEFRALYENLRWDGLEFQAAEFIPKVHHSERARYEEDSRIFYTEHYPELDEYRGFVGLEVDQNDSGDISLESRSVQPFYYPIHYVEPVVDNAAAIDFDLYSSESRRSMIETALETWNATLSSRIRQETEETAYNVLLMHPGIRVEAEPEASPSDLSALVIPISSLIHRAIQLTHQIEQVYIYDSSLANEENPPEFLGAGEILVDHNMKALPEMDYVKIREAYQTGGKYELFYEVPIPIESRTWTIVIVPVEGTFEMNLKFVFLGGAIILLASIGLSIWMYHSAKRRNAKMRQIVEKAEAERLIVSSMFPSNVRARLLETVGGGIDAGKKKNAIEDQSMPSPIGTSPKSVFGSQPIADLFPNTTVMVADLVGFTAWSSVREPAQVFTLLETVYHSFDTISTRLGVFKVETIGDCYVAVAGLPHPRRDHAVVMARFATECLLTLRYIARELEPNLGPTTGDIQMRVGLHSGPVTAGVLRGLKGRFQLFGDTMNTASRMECTSLDGRIQVSPNTAALLRQHGKECWLTPRENIVTAKGIGEIVTYWLDLRKEYVMNDHSISLNNNKMMTNTNNNVNKDSLSIYKIWKKQSQVSNGTVAPEDHVDDTEVEKQGRLIDWNVQILGGLLKKIVASRLAKRTKDMPRTISESTKSTSTESIPSLNDSNRDQNTIPMDEVKGIISLPSCEECTKSEQEQANISPESIELDPTVLDELTKYVSTIASLYRTNPFHNFEHASHVTMSVTKLLFRIINPKYMDKHKKNNMKKNRTCSTTGEKKRYGCDLHSCTFGISSDPITQFACAFTALVHDVDHLGVPNSTLVKEGTAVAKTYRNKSVAEQNSIEIAWKILMGDKFVNLRNCIFSTHEEYIRFRQLTVNLVMATDVIDKEIGALRKARWEKAFATTKINDSKAQQEQQDQTEHISREFLPTFVRPSNTNTKKQEQEDINRKATIVLEHIIQASDVSHTMQHWHVYIKWNRCLFHEMYRAYQEGRIDQDPSIGWYEGEKGFFDFYIIPLAKNLETCGVFGVSSHEYLDYAIRNRQRWEKRGRELIEDYMNTYKTHHEISIDETKEDMC